MAEERGIPDQTVTKDSYTFSFNPAFASKCTVREASGTDIEMYQQQGSYKLPPGMKHPPTRHHLRFSGGKQGQDFGLQITDPKLRIKKITIELHDESHEPGRGEAGNSSETIVVENDATCCPPICL